MRQHAAWLALLCMLLAGACGNSSFEAENLAVAQPFTELEQLLEVDSVSSESYCRSDSCWFGNDATMTSISFTLGDETTADEFAADLAAELPGWEVTSVDCQAPDADCNGREAIVLLRDEDAFSIDILSDTTGVILVSSH